MPIAGGSGMNDRDRDDGIEAVRVMAGDHGVEVLKELLRDQEDGEKQPRL
jgi:hypothetical protein